IRFFRRHGSGRASGRGDRTQRRLGEELPGPFWPPRFPARERALATSVPTPLPPGKCDRFRVGATMEEIVILEGARTPMAEYNGVFSDISAIDLGVVASREALKRSQTDPAEIDHVIFGNALQTSGDAIYGARHVG